MPDLAAAEQFLAAHARVLDRRRFERFFAGGEAGPVRDAVAAYRNADGGFGQGLEPDGRCPGSQPPAVALALRVLHEADAWDPELVQGACDWLAATAPAAGGTPFVDPSVEGWPRAPWWQVEEGLPPSLVSTGVIAEVLLARGVEHPWLDRAVAWLRQAAPAATTPYDLYGALAFAEHEPGLAERLAPAVADAVTLDPDAEGEVHGPLGFAPRPESAARAQFEPADIERHLDALERGQREDGGWTFNFPAWLPAQENDWRGAVTVDALVTLRANGRAVS
jgi:hypothetical protein